MSQPVLLRTFRVPAVFVVIVLLLSSLIVAPRIAEAQNDDGQTDPSKALAAPAVLLEPGVVDQAFAVVNGVVASSRTVEIEGLPYTFQRIDVSESLTGSVASEIDLITPGGVMDDGTVLQRSEAAPIAEVGASIQVALVEPPPYMRPYLSNDVKSYWVSNGEAGIALAGQLAPQQLFTEGVSFAFNGVARSGWIPPQRYLINPAGSGLSATATIAAVRAAFDSWEDDLFSSIDFTYGGQTNATGVNQNDRLAVVSFQRPNAGNSFDSNDLAVAFFNRSQFDIIFNSDRPWAVGAVNNRFDIETVAIHEVGHGVGLGHVSDQNQIMFPNYQGVRGIGQGDRTGVRQLYPDVGAQIFEPGHSIASNPSGHLAVSLLRKTGRLIVAQNLGSAWEVTNLGEFFVSTDVAITPAGGAFVAGIKSNGRLYTGHLLPNGTLAEWRLHPGTWDTAIMPSIATNRRRTVVAAVDSFGVLQTAERVTSWTAFSPHRAGGWSHVDIDIADDGDIWFVGTTRSAELLVRSKINGRWGPYSSQGQAWSLQTAPSIAARSNGVVIAAIKINGQLFTRHQGFGVWRRFEGLGDNWASIDLSMNDAGRAWLAGVKTNNRLFTATTTPLSTWRDWTWQGLYTRQADPSISVGLQGRPVFLAVKDTGRGWIRERGASSWLGWEPLGAAWATGR